MGCERRIVEAWNRDRIRLVLSAKAIRTRCVQAAVRGAHHRSGLFCWEALKEIPDIDAEWAGCLMPL